MANTVDAPAPPPRRGHAHREGGDHPRRRPAGGFSGITKGGHGEVAEGVRANTPRDRPVRHGSGQAEHLGTQCRDRDRRRRGAGDRQRAPDAVRLAVDIDRLAP